MLSRRILAYLSSLALVVAARNLALYFVIFAFRSLISSSGVAMSETR